MTESQWLLAALLRLAGAGWSPVTMFDGEEDGIPVETPAEVVEMLDGLEMGEVTLMNKDASQSVTLLVVWQGNTDSPEECIANYAYSGTMDVDAFDALLYGEG